MATSFMVHCATHQTNTVLHWPQQMLTIATQSLPAGPWAQMPHLKQKIKAASSKEWGNDPQHKVLYLWEISFNVLNAIHHIIIIIIIIIIINPFYFDSWFLSSRNLLSFLPVACAMSWQSIATVSVLVTRTVASTSPLNSGKKNQHFRHFQPCFLYQFGIQWGLVFTVRCPLSTSRCALAALGYIDGKARKNNNSFQHEPVSASFADTWKADIAASITAMLPKCRGDCHVDFVQGESTTTAMCCLLYQIGWGKLACKCNNRWAWEGISSWDALGKIMVGWFSMVSRNATKNLWCTLSQEAEVQSHKEYQNALKQVQQSTPGNFRFVIHSCDGKSTKVPESNVEYILLILSGRYDTICMFEPTSFRVNLPSMFCLWRRWTQFTWNESRLFWFAKLIFNKYSNS